MFFAKTVAIGTFPLWLFFCIGQADAAPPDTLFQSDGDLPIEEMVLPVSDTPHFSPRHYILSITSATADEPIEFEGIFFTSHSYNSFFKSPKPRYQYLLADALKKAWPAFTGDKDQFPFGFRLKEKTPLRLEVRYSRLVAVFRSLSAKDRLVLKIIDIGDGEMSDVPDSLVLSIQGLSVLFAENFSKDGWVQQSELLAK